MSCGYRIGALEVEDCLRKEEYVKECGVVGSGDEMRGNMVKGLVILEDDVGGRDERVKRLQNYV
ncbi:AMP-binding enzyme, partial [Staphylococcus saprophyticus]